MGASEDRQVLTRDKKFLIGMVTVRNMEEHTINIPFKSSRLTLERKDLISSCSLELSSSSIPPYLAAKALLLSSL